jgi:putative Mg2+ transporter-C (MgtC) family protein
VENYDFIFKLGAALFLGLLIGVDRQLKHKPLGMKTSMVISVASCLITLVSIKSVQKYSIPGQTNMDPMRLAAQIVSGVGFIGAGVILRRSNEMISGLTTAAMVWAASALGIAAGTGFYAEAIVAVLFIIMATNLFPVIVKLWGPQKLREKDISVHVVVKDELEMMELIQHIEANYKVKHIKVKDIGEKKQEIHFILTASEKNPCTTIYSEIKKQEHVLAVEVETISS